MSLFVAVASGMDVSNVVDSTSCPNSPHATTTPHDITSLASQPHNIPFHDITSLHIRSHDTASQYMTTYHRTLRDITPRDMTCHLTTYHWVPPHILLHIPPAALLNLTSPVIRHHSTAQHITTTETQPTTTNPPSPGGMDKRWCMHSFGKFFLWLI